VIKKLLKKELVTYDMLTSNIVAVHEIRRLSVQHAYYTLNALHCTRFTLFSKFVRWLENLGTRYLERLYVEFATC